MKRPIFVMVILVAIAFAGPMLMKKPDGTPFLELPWQQAMDQALDSAEEKADGLTSQQSFYKWQDEDGSWHYSDTPRAQGNVETVTVNTNTNLIQGLREEKKQAPEVIEEKEKPEAQAPSIPLPMTVPMDKVSDMIKDAQNLQQVLEKRNEQMQNGGR